MYSNPLIVCRSSADLQGDSNAVPRQEERAPPMYHKLPRHARIWSIQSLKTILGISFKGSFNRVARRSS